MSPQGTRFDDIDPFFLLIITIVYLLIVFNLVYVAFIVGGRAGIAAVSVVVGSLLSFGLVLLYFSQTRIQRSQTQLMRAERTPLVLGTDVEPVVSNPDLGRGEYFDVELVNEGNEIATNLRLIYLINYADGNQDFTVDNRDSELRYPTAGDFASETHGTVLPEDLEESRTLYAKAGFRIIPDDGDAYDESFSNTMAAIVEDADWIQFGLVIAYENPVGDPFHSKVATAYEFSDPEGPMEFPDAIAEATEIDIDDVIERNAWVPPRDPLQIDTS